MLVETFNYHLISLSQWGRTLCFYYLSMYENNNKLHLPRWEWKRPFKKFEKQVPTTAWQVCTNCQIYSLKSVLYGELNNVKNLLFKFDRLRPTIANLLLCCVWNVFYFSNVLCTIKNLSIYLLIYSPFNYIEVQ
jgi:hypothetical protein